MSVTKDDAWLVWYDASRRDEIDQAIRALYDELAVVVAERRPVCNASGRCCKFETYGHRLYVTGLEIAWFLLGVGSQVSGDGGERVESIKDSQVDAAGLSLQQFASTPNTQDPTRDACPYQVNGLCSTHLIRPLGCRAFFCEEGTEAWQQDKTEHFLERLKQLHVEHELPYAYMEWRAGLAEAGRVLGHYI